MKKILSLIIFSLLWIIPVSADDNCVDKNPEIILDLGGTPEPEKIIYATYDSCTKMHDYCGIMGCSLEVFDDKGNYAKGYIAKDDWYIKPINEEEGVGKKPTYELVVPLANGDLRIIKVINDKITETIVKK
tara:strand:- start:110 stop:502 length:393 start_codon:yes stop_codon:yes gene_type:complete